jgi:hypothetical protein
MKSTFTSGAALGLLLALGCGGGSSLPPARVTETQSAISAAEAVGATNNPRAALHLKLARDQMKGAESLIREGDEDEAKLMLDRARVDAELALVLTRGAEQRAEAMKALEQVRNLEAGQ